MAGKADALGLAAGEGGGAAGEGEVIEADINCAVTGMARDRHGGVLLVHDCSATRGTSGGPLLIRDGTGRLVLAGVQVAARDARAGGVAVPVDTVRGLLVGVTR